LAHSEKNLQHINGVQFPISDSSLLLIVNLAVLLTVCEIFFVSSLKFSVFTFCIAVVDAQRRNDQHYYRNLYVAKK